MDEKIVSEEIIETVEDIVSNGSGKALKVAGKIGLALIVGGLTYRFVVRPIIRKVKARKNQTQNAVDNHEFDEDEQES